MRTPTSAWLRLEVEHKITNGTAAITVPGNAAAAVAALRQACRHRWPRHDHFAGRRPASFTMEVQRPSGR